jgi:hypothetical protein
VERHQHQRKAPGSRTGSPVLGSYYLSSNRSSWSAQFNDEDRQRNNQEQVDQDSAEMQPEAQKPQNQKNNENRPNHLGASLSHAGARFRSRPPEACLRANGEEHNDALCSRFRRDSLRHAVHVGPMLLEALARRIIQTLANRN